MNKVTTTKAYDAFWKFAYERQKAFFKKIENAAYPWTDDPIIQQYRFTNVYRVTDRVSQYLLQNIIYTHESYSAEDLVFRILLFKIFNKIETWELLEAKLGTISYSEFDFDTYDSILQGAIDQKEKIYSAAYIMPSGKSSFGFDRKHRNNLALIDQMMREGITLKIAQAKSLKDIYTFLLSFPSLGSFLAFQYAIDINYSELCDFSEMSFVVAGPGAKSGIEKCFGIGVRDYEYYIRYVAEHQAEEFEKRGLRFRNLFGRPLQLIDCQNIFCETDKYTRIACPEVTSLQNRTRIKQLYKPKWEGYKILLPPKWKCNVIIEL